MRKSLIILSILILGSCISPFESENLEFKPVYVVEGIITDEIKAHEIRLSQTTSVDSLFYSPSEGAQIELIQDDETVIFLTEIQPGTYATPIMKGRVESTYELNILINELEIVSDPVILKKSPEISALTGTFTSNGPSQSRGVEILLSTQELEAGSLNLRWEFEETYEIRSIFPYRYNWIGGNEVMEVDVKDSDVCYLTTVSSSVLLFSGANLSTQSVSKAPIQFLPELSPELQSAYSILVKQYAVSLEGYDFWQVQSSLSSGQGTTFDIQPGTPPGNLKASDGRKILGFFDASEIKTKRIFVRPFEFHDDEIVLDRTQLDLCNVALEAILVNDLGAYMSRANNSERKNIVGAIGSFGVVTGYLVATKECTDCRLFASNVKPGFWP